MVETTEAYFSYLEARSPRARCEQIQCLVRRALFVTWRQLASCCVLTWQRQRGLVFPSLLMRALIPSWRLHPHDLISNYLPKASPANTITQVVRASACELWEDINIQSVTRDIRPHISYVTVLSLCFYYYFLLVIELIEMQAMDRWGKEKDSVCAFWWYAPIPCVLLSSSFSLDVAYPFWKVSLEDEWAFFGGWVGMHLWKLHIELSASPQLPKGRVTPLKG